MKRERPVQVKQKPEKKIVASDYQAWEKFDAVSIISTFNVTRNI